MKIRIRIEFKKEDMWIGWFWKTSENISSDTLDIWVIIPPFGIPCFPIHIFIERERGQKKW